MGLFKRSAEEKAAVAALRAADAALHERQRHEIAAGIREETQEYLRLNAAANAAARAVPWWRGGTKRRAAASSTSSPTG